MAKVDSILEEIKGLTLLEASDLVKKMEEAFGWRSGCWCGSCGREDRIHRDAYRRGRQQN
jgi:hypothetical protein